MTTFKFLMNGARGPFSGFAWPSPRGSAPGEWVEVDGPLALCVRGVHVCRAVDLAHWLHDELWEVETAGERIEGLDCLIVRRARLLRRISSWTDGGAMRFSQACIEHAATLAGTTADDTVSRYLEDAKHAANAGYVAVSAHAAALAVAKLGPAAENESVFRRERVWQASWITRELIAS